MKLIYVFITLLIPVIISAQSDKLKGKVIDNSKKPVSNLLIRFTSIGDAVTTSSGEFIISVPQNVLYVDVAIKDDSLQLLYPVDSKIPIPSDPNFVTTIIVSKIKTPNTGVNESLKKYTELEKLLKETGSTNKELQDFLKRYIEIESGRLEMDKAKLEYEFKKKENRDELFSVISPVLSEYISELKDLKNVFETNFEIAFVSNPGTENLNKAIREYNPLFDTLNNNYKTWQREIGNSWDDNLSEKFVSAVNYMIDEIHKPYIFQLNESIKLINEIKLRIEKDEEKREEKKKEVRDNISSIMKNLEIKIPILENRFNELVNILQFAEVN